MSETELWVNTRNGQQMSLRDATLSTFIGVTASAALIPSVGLVPSPILATAGDVLKADGSWGAGGTPGPGSVTNAMLADMLQQLIKARKTLSTGAPEDCTITEILDFIPATAARGDIIYRGASNYVRLPPGTSGRFLQTLGAGADPQWAVPTSVGGIATIASGNISSGTSVIITDIPATYAYLLIKLTNVSMDTNTRMILTQLSTNNGSSYDTTAGNYVGFRVDSAALVSNPTAATIAEGTLVNAANTSNVEIAIFGYQGGPFIQSLSRYVGSNTHFNTTNYIGSVSAINAIRFILSGSGSFDGAGTYALYGVS